jgi:fructokinase
MVRYAGIEGGGTKFVIAFGSGPEDLSSRIVFPTEEPTTTLDRAVEEIRNGGDVDAVGIASFGPVDLRPGSRTFGNVLETPKPGWSGARVVGLFQDALSLPVGFDTDVNGAALGERRWGVAQGLESFIYMTVGTGIGGGGVYNGQPMHGLNHPEMGHLRIPRHPADDFPGTCPFHGDCLEGMAAGPAIEARWGRRGEDLGPRAGAAVELEAWYLGTALADLCLTLSPERIILGGGVMKLPSLLEAVRGQFLDRLGGYLTIRRVLDAESFVVAPGLRDRAGVLGAIVLAERAHHPAP